MTAPQKEQYVTPREVAQSAGMSRATIYVHIAKGNLRTKKLGTLTVATREDAQEFLSRLTKIKLGSREVSVFQ